MTDSDFVVVGGGIIGLATARALLERNPGAAITVLEKEPALGRHQTGHNSGVLHSGIYYKPGSLKARLCVAGVEKMRRLCGEHGIAIADYGKVVVAVDDGETAYLRTLHERGSANGVPDLELIDADRLRSIEPNVAGIAALWVPTAASLDFGEVVQALAKSLQAEGVRIVTGAPVEAIEVGTGSAVLATPDGAYSARFYVNCAGLHVDRVARLAGVAPGMKIVPFRGEYFYLAPEASDLVNGLIYPVPDPRFPFLGVHFTRTVHGRVEAGPNAVLALAREGYTWRTIRLADLAETLRFRGFRAVARRYWRTGAAEVWRSWSKRAFTRALQRLVPAVTTADLARGSAGVRAQAILEDGTLADDFVLMRSPRGLHVLNAPSPGATASLAIGEHLAAMVDDPGGAGT